eukprot:scaffold4216_cov145-Isochrysis_galbana.AAC.1
MFATVHAAGSSLLGLFTSCATFDATVGRHGSGVAVERCAVFGAVRAGSVLLLGFCVVGRWVGHDCFTCGCCCLRPHTIIPLPWRERGIQFPQHKNKHTSQARGDYVATRQGRHKGAGKGTYTSCSEGGGPLRGGLPTPLSGVRGRARSLANTYRRCGISETHPGEGRNFETSARDERLEDVGGNEGGREWNIVTCWRDGRRCSRSQFPHMKPHPHPALWMKASEDKPARRTARRGARLARPA